MQLFGQEDESFEIHGTVAPGFEAVRQLFREGFERGLETNAQCCAYVGQEKVVDLWGREKGNRNYDADSLAMVFSSTKSVTAIVFATLVDQGLINYDDKVSSVWPEFSQNGKEHVTFDSILRHESGLARVNWEVFPEAFLTENIKKNVLGECIEKEKLRFPLPDRGTKRQYHTISGGIILNEIFRRVDPRRRTIGEYLRSELSEPYGIDVHIGITEEEKQRLQALQAWSFQYVFFQQMLPDFLGSKIENSTLGYLGSLYKTYRLSRPRRPLPWESTNFYLPDFSVWSKDWVLKSEFPSANGICSARGLARLAAAMANGGEAVGLRLMSEATWEKMHGLDSKRVDAVQNIPGLSPTIFTQGGLSHFCPVDGESEKSREVRLLRDGFYGWYGLGGSVFQWNPELKVGFAYVPTLMAWYDAHALRGARLQRMVADCARERQSALG